MPRTFGFDMPTWLPVLLLVGCVSTPTNLVLVARGPKPDLKAALELVHTSLRRTLKDYDSLKDFAVRNDDLQPISATNAAFNFEEAWMLCVEYNAKNSFGGYTGLKQHGFPMRLDSSGKPYVVSTINWRTNANGSC